MALLGCHNTVVPRSACTELPPLPGGHRAAPGAGSTAAACLGLRGAGCCTASCPGSQARPRSRGRSLEQGLLSRLLYTSLRSHFVFYNAVSEARQEGFCHRLVGRNNSSAVTTQPGLNHHHKTIILLPLARLLRPGDSFWSKDRIVICGWVHLRGGDSEQS